MRKILLILIFGFLIEETTAQETNDNAFLDYISFYQNYISHIRGGDCQMYPSCSNYGLIAFQNYSSLKAMVITSDRLLRCSHDINFYNLTLKNNEFKLIDLPVSNDSLERKSKFKKQTVTYPYKTFNNDSCPEAGFIRFLMLEKNYREALLEINRLFYYKHNCNQKELYLNYLRCKRTLNEIEEAIFKFENSFPEEIKNNSEIISEIGNCYLDLGNFEQAIKLYKSTISLNNSIKPDKIYSLLGLAYAQEFEFKKSSEYFLKINKESPLFYNANNCVTILNFMDNYKYKKKYIAGILSIIPGAGYYYSGHKSSAISSLIVNSLLGYALYSNIKNENYGMATLVGVFSFSFYIGNISGSIKSTKRYNKVIDNKIINQIKSNVYY